VFVEKWMMAAVIRPAFVYPTGAVDLSTLARLHHMQAGAMGQEIYMEHIVYHQGLQQPETVVK
jgi:hypothetical protein